MGQRVTNPTTLYGVRPFGLSRRPAQRRALLLIFRGDHHPNARPTAGLNPCLTDLCHARAAAVVVTPDAGSLCCDG